MSLRMTRTIGARALVDILLAQGVERVFSVPGESFLPVLDALRDVEDRIATIVCRHEAAAANMAEATGKLTGRPGIAFVTRGPGATHASTGLHTARQDSSPMILFIGQIARGDREREAFQEIDYRAFFGPLTKWTAEIDDPSRMPELVERAFATTMQGRMGPVALALPEDMLSEETQAQPGARVSPARAALEQDALDKIATRLAAAQRPLLILGGSDWDELGVAAIADFAARADLPTILSFRRKHLLNNDAPTFVGDLGLGANPSLLARIKQADLILTIGARLGDNPTQGYTLFTRQETAQKLIHIHADPEELGRVWPALFAAIANSGVAAAQLAALDIAPRWREWRSAARAEYEAFIQPVETVGAVNPSKIFAHLAETLPQDAIITNDAGNFAVWLHRFYRHRLFRTQLGPTSGAMGYGVPSAIAAKLAFPEREVIGVVGDGGFLMSGQELATCMRHGIAPIFLLVDNASYGTIRMHQERAFPGRNHATDLVNPDFAAYARAFGVWAKTVTRTEDFPAALAEARALKGPALLHLKTDLEDILPGRRLSVTP
jgi:acetolactate synthase I/II/III large subunit